MKTFKKAIVIGASSGIGEAIASELSRHGLELRHAFVLNRPRAELPDRFAPLWDLKRRIPFDESCHRRDFRRYRRSMPQRVDQLIELLCRESGLAEPELLDNYNFLQAFSHARQAAAWQPHYLHSYFFYEASLYAFVSAYFSLRCRPSIFLLAASAA